ncbi:hypothetical protein [Spirosoma endbachense]|uniref:Uncharacterized protein n=1 Tax=Spirosoma endbachense TaxID=2666025 RepID=A0A6P1W6S9_9BACT|nr:hypothetical protein [Spirosoma endbachense]QHW01044.1 hypothetical protein GJR95_41105 [Spirosoma endbachense]
MPEEDFVKGFYELKTDLLKRYFSPSQDEYFGSPIAKMIESLDVDSSETSTLYKILDGALTDALYTVLLGLDGEASIGDNNQQMYKLFNEAGNELTNSGEIESYAWEYFHNPK